MTRKPLSQKVRFDTFKRDFFTCQYCGNTPPAVILQVDHIQPVSKGGGNETDNLITACQNCNQGKGATDLETIPEPLLDRQQQIAEKEDQLREYKKLLKRRKRRQDAEVKEIEEIFSEIGSLTSADKLTIRARFLEHLMPDDVEDSMRLAVSKIREPNRAWKYFCGICWNKIKRREEDG